VPEATIFFHAQDQDARLAEVGATDTTAPREVAWDFALTFAQVSALAWWTSVGGLLPPTSPITRKRWRSGDEVLRVLNAGVQADHGLAVELDEHAQTLADLTER